jgi:hypothetical protein
MTFSTPIKWSRQMDADLQRYLSEGLNLRQVGERLGGINKDSVARRRDRLRNPTGRPDATIWTPEQDAQIHAMVKKRVKACDQAKALGVTVAALARRRRFLGIPSGNQFWSAEDSKRAAELREKGLSVDGIAHAMGFNPTTVRQHLLMDGVSVRQVPPQAPEPEPKPVKTYGEFEDLIIRKDTIYVNQSTVDGFVTGVVPVSVSAGLEWRQSA